MHLCYYSNTLTTGQREALLTKLVEVEVDGKAAAKQVSALQDVIRRFREVSEHISNHSTDL